MFPVICLPPQNEPALPSIRQIKSSVLSSERHISFGFVYMSCYSRYRNALFFSVQIVYSRFAENAKTSDLPYRYDSKVSTDIFRCNLFQSSKQYISDFFRNVLQRKRKNVVGDNHTENDGATTYVLCKTDRGGQ